MALKDTLKHLKRQKEADSEWESKKPEVIKEWNEAVTKLFAEIRNFLTEYEKQGSMSFADSNMQLSEERLGTYSTHQLNIDVPPFKIIVAPVGRMVVGAAGRVDMYRQARVGEADRIKFLRVPKSATDSTLQWAISSPPEIGTPTSRTARRGPLQLLVLSKSALEHAVDFLLKRQ
jgi:hypothetical protein